MDVLFVLLFVLSFFLTSYLIYANENRDMAKILYHSNEYRTTFKNVVPK